MVLTRAGALALVALLAGCGGGTRGPLELWEELGDAYARGDVDGAALVFAEDARWFEGEALQHEGREAIRARVAFEVGLGTRRVAEGEAVRVGDGARVLATTTSDLREALGLAPSERRWVVAADAGALRLARLLPDPPPDAGDAARLEAFLAWVRDERPADWAALAPDGAVALTHEVGARLVELARARAAAQR